MSVAYEPRNPDTIADPFPVLTRLREEEPLHWSRSLRGWVVTRYADCQFVTLDKRFSADRMRPFFEHLPPDRRAQVKELEWSVGLWAVFQDPPEHTRLRRLLNRGFTSRAIERVRPRIVDIVDELLDGIIDRGEMDVIRDFAYPLPASVVMEMLGVPRSELDNFKTWSDDLALFVGGALITPEKYDRAEAATVAMSECFRGIIAERRAAPRDDMISELIAAEEAGSMLSEEELIATCILLLFAGHETTANLIGNGLYYLMRFPEQQARLRADPSLAATAVEEFLRYDGPSGALVRVAHADVPLHGATIRKGDRVFAMLNAANRDPRAFDDPDRFDIGRPVKRNVTFGHGIHFCLGAPLARLEGQIAIPRVLERLTDLTIASDALVWSDSMILRGLTSLPIRFRAA